MNVPCRRSTPLILSRETFELVVVARFAGAKLAFKGVVDIFGAENWHIRMCEHSFVKSVQGFEAVDDRNEEQQTAAS
jgi:hypothetical protein